MKNIDKQKGSVLHIVLVGALVLVILGALGFVLWKNLSKDGESVTAQYTDQDTSKTTDSIDTDVPDPETPTPTLVSNTFMSSDNFSISYQMPNTWTGGKYGGGDTLSDEEKTTLKAPDGFTIYLSMSRLQRGWGQDSPTATILEVQKSAKNSLTWLVVDHLNGSTGPISLQINNSQTTPAVGSKKVAGSSIYKLGEAEGSGVYLEIYGSYAQSMSLSEFNAKDSVKQAKAIFESIKVE